ncbi:MAG: hypothetical protein GXO74_13260 [Calditrichaeota bacterium]|nr:hypothetical protein [Calditrichota bacterium]
MDRNVIGVIVGFAFVFLMIFVATVIQKIFKLSNDFSRKIIHISVGNWLFFALYYFTKWEYAIIGPVVFIFLNYLSYRTNLFAAMELKEKNPGTVYYAISLTICTLLTFVPSPIRYLPFLGILAMTWGDGFAAVIGKNFPVKQIRPGKSWGGSLAFFVFAGLSAAVYLFIFQPEMAASRMSQLAIGTAFLGAVIEIFSPKNTDNLTVPIIIGVLAFVLGI